MIFYVFIMELFFYERATFLCQSLFRESSIQIKIQKLDICKILCFVLCVKSQEIEVEISFCIISV